MRVESLFIRGMSDCPELELIDLSQNVALAGAAHFRAAVADALELWFAAMDITAMEKFWTRRFGLSDLEVISDALPDQLFWADGALLDGWLTERSLTVVLQVSLTSAQVGWLLDRIVLPELRMGLMEQASFSMKLGLLLNGDHSGVSVSRSDFKLGSLGLPLERPSWLSAWLTSFQGSFARVLPQSPQQLSSRLMAHSLTIKRGDRLLKLRKMLSDFGPVRAALGSDSAAVVLVGERSAEAAGELFWLRLSIALACYEQETHIVWLGELAALFNPDTPSHQLWVASDDGHRLGAQRPKQLSFPKPDLS